MTSPWAWTLEEEQDSEDFLCPSRGVCRRGCEVACVGLGALGASCWVLCLASVCPSLPELFSTCRLEFAGFFPTPQLRIEPRACAC